MNGVKRGAALLLALCMLLILATGCKKEQAPNASPAQNTPLPMGTKGQDPLTNLLRDTLDGQSMRVGEMAMMFEGYVGADGKDYSALSTTILTPFARMDALLADVMVLSFTMMAQQDGTFAAATETSTAQLTPNEQGYAYTARTAQSQAQYQRHNAQMQHQGSQLTITLHDKQAEEGEVQTLYWQRLVRDGTAYVQAYVVQEDGSFQLLRYRMSESAFAFAVYEQGKDEEEVGPQASLFSSQVDLFSLPLENFFQAGYVTHATYENNKVVLENDAKTMTVQK